jgi:hypothetical protein
MNLISANDFVWSPTAITLPSFDFSKETRDWTPFLRSRYRLRRAGRADNADSNKCGKQGTETLEQCRQIDGISFIRSIRRGFNSHGSYLCRIDAQASALMLAL